MKRLILILVLIFICFSNVNAGWGDKFKSSVGNYKNKISKSYNNTKKKVSNSYKKSKERSKSYYNNSKQKAKSSYNNLKQKSQKTYSSIKTNYTNKYNSSKQKAYNTYNNSKNKISNSYSNIKSNTYNKYNSNKQNYTDKIKNYTSNIKNNVKQYATNSKNTFSNKTSSLRQNMNQIKSKYGSKGRDILNQINNKYDNQVKTTITSSLSKLKGNAVMIYNKSKDKINHINNVIKDPNTKKKLIKGAIVGAAVSYYAYQHQDDIKYTAIKTLAQTNINVNGQNQSLESLMTNEIKKRYPQLEGTKLAEDPLSYVAYGIPAIGKEDMIHNVKLIKDSSGNRRSLSDTFPIIDSAEDAESALDMNSNIERIAMDNASHGNFGSYAQEFTIQHKNLEDSFGNN